MHDTVSCAHGYNRHRAQALKPLECMLALSKVMAIDHRALALEFSGLTELPNSTASALRPWKSAAVSRLCSLPADHARNAPDIRSGATLGRPSTSDFNCKNPLFRSFVRKLIHKREPNIDTCSACGKVLSSGSRPTPPRITGLSPSGWGRPWPCVGRWYARPLPTLSCFKSP